MKLIRFVLFTHISRVICHFTIAFFDFCDMTPTLCCSWHSFEGSLHSVKECGLQKNILWSRSYNHHRSACGAIFQFCYFGLFGSGKPTLKILNICRWPTIPTNEWRESQRLRTTSSDRDLPRRKSSCSCTLQFTLSTLQFVECTQLQLKIL